MIRTRWWPSTAGALTSSTARAGTISLWLDSGVGFRDGGSGERTHLVSRFVNTADRTLDGDRLADPTDGTWYQNFADKPLFAVGGPSVNDVDQGNLGDCWMLAAVGSVAMDNPTAVRHMVADFGDGTYGVKLGDNFYRVDADLPTGGSVSTRPDFAGLGQQESLWVALVEKAYALHRTGANTYASLEGGWADEALRAYNLTSVGTGGFFPTARPADIGNALYERWAARQSCTICFGLVPAGSPLVARHCYTVTAVFKNTAGEVTGVELRNPWGGSSAYVRLTPAQLAGAEIMFAWGNS